MFLSACVLAMLPGAGPGHAVAAVAPADGGKLLFVAMSGAAPDTGWVCVWDLTKPELKAVITGLPANVRTIQPTADGKRFVLIGGDGWLVTHFAVWDTTTKKPLRAFDVPAKDSALTAVSPDGNWVVYRPLKEEKAEVRVWNTATGKKAGGWERPEPPEAFLSIRAGTPVILPNGKGVVSVNSTANRRQSYVVRIVTEKKDWLLGSFWDGASNPIVSPDGRLLIVSGGRGDEAGTFVLKLDADGAPELEDPPAKPVGPRASADGKKFVAWRECTLGEADRAGGQYLGPLASAAESKRLFVGGSLGRLRVYDADTRELKATLFAAVPKNDEVPAWHIVTAAGGFVGSPAEAETLAKSGKAKDAAKVKDALGVK